MNSPSLQFLQFLNPHGHFFIRVLDEGPGNKNHRFLVDTGNVNLETMQQIQDLNDRGYGVHFVPHAVPNNLPGRLSDSLITEILSVYVDFDNANLDIDNVDWGQTEPNAIVKTKNGYHAYWKIADCSKTQWIKIQKELIKRFKDLGADANITYPSHTMRLPGSQTRKDSRSNPDGLLAVMVRSPFDCEFTIKHNNWYMPSNFEVAVDNGAVKASNFNAPPSSLESLLSALRSACQETGLRNVNISAIGCRIGSAFGLGHFEISLEELISKVTDVLTEEGMEATEITSCTSAIFKGNNNSDKYAEQGKKTLSSKSTLADWVENYGSWFESRNYQLNIVENQYGRMVGPEFIPLFGRGDITDEALYLCCGEKLPLSHQMAVNLIDYYCQRTAINAPQQYLLGLEGDDDAPSIIDDLASRVFGNKLENPDFANKAMKLFLVGSAGRMLKPGIENPYILLLQGAQGIGKTWFFTALAGEHNVKTYHPEASFADNMQAAHSSWLFNIDEFDGTTSKKDFSHLKSLISSTADTWRNPYARVSQNRNRQFSWVATVNPYDVLADDTGNRRFLVIGLTRKENEQANVQYIKDNRDLIWYQAKREFLNHPELQSGIFADSQLEKEIAAQNALHQVVEPVLQAVINCVERVYTSGEPIYPLRACDLFSAMPQDIWGNNPRVLSRALTATSDGITILNTRYHVAQPSFNAKVIIPCQNKGKLWLKNREMWVSTVLPRLLLKDN